MRLDKMLANMGLGSRTAVKEKIKKSRVLVNDKVIKNSKFHVDPYKDLVVADGTVVHYREFIYVMMNKPQGYISATEDFKDKTVIDLLEASIQNFAPFPVGRLDKNTEGFVLMTNNGQLAHQLLSPKKGIKKKYFAKVRGIVTEDDLNAFEKGIILDDGYETKPAKLTIIKSNEISEIELTITEGKFHQVKRMFEAVDKKVIYLKRLSIGNLQLDESLKLGEYRELLQEELNYCLALIPEELK